MLKLIYNPYMNTVSYQFRNDENTEWKNVDVFSDFCNKEYLGWKCVKQALSDNYEKYYETRNVKNTQDGSIQPDKNDIFFKGTEAHKHELEELIPEFSIHVEDGDFLCKKEDFICLYNEIIKNDNAINNLIKKRADEIIKDLFILFDNEITGIYKSSVFKRRKAEWIRDFIFKENSDLENPINPDVSDEGLLKILEGKTNSYKEGIQRFEVLLQKNTEKHADLMSEIEQNKLVNCIMTAFESAIDTDVIILRLKKSIEGCNWTDKFTVDEYCCSICNAIDKEIISLTKKSKRKIKSSVTKQLKHYNNESIKKLKKYTDIYKVISFSDYCKRKQSGLKPDEIEDYELVNKVRCGAKKKVSLDSQETQYINEAYTGEEGLISAVKEDVQAYYIDQMDTFLEDTLGFVRTNVLLYFVCDKYIDLRDLENQINICEYTMKLLKEQYIKLEQLRKNPDEKIVTQKKIASEKKSVAGDKRDSDYIDISFQESPVDECTENNLNSSSGDVLNSGDDLLDYDEINKWIEDAWKCSVHMSVSGDAKDTKYILYESETDLNQNIRQCKNVIDKETTIIVDIVGIRQLLARIKSKRLNSNMNLKDLPKEISSAANIVMKNLSKNQKK